LNHKPPSGAFDSNRLPIDQSLIWWVFFPPVFCGIIAVLIAHFPLLDWFSSRINEGEKNRNNLVHQNLDEKFYTAFYRKNQLVQFAYKESIDEQSQIVQFMEGGSEAITVIVDSQSTLKVRKIIEANKCDSLKKQASWLQKYSHITKFPSLLGSSLKGDFYFIDLEFIPNAIQFFDLIHSTEIEDSKKLISDAFSLLSSSVYESQQMSLIKGTTKKYYQTYFVERLHSASRKSSDIRKVLDYQGKVYINGSRVRGFKQCLELIELMDSEFEEMDAQTPDTKYCHGDLTVSNILINSGENDLNLRGVYLIDPSDNNPIHSSVLDIARMMQSLDGGYEFLLRNSEKPDCNFSIDSLHINFNHFVSRDYNELREFLLQDVVPSVAPKIKKETLYLHLAIMFGRMMEHRVRIEPETALKYLAISLRYLNRFLDQSFRE
jgi:hypothetical protein